MSRRDYFVLDDIIKLAKEVHGDQIRQGSGLPYWTHLEAVSQIVAQHYDFDVRLCATAWLHDALEDTDCTEEQIIEASGYLKDSILQVVKNCTDEKGLKGNPRRTAKLKFIQTLPRHDEARFVMQADVLHNLSSCYTGYLEDGVDHFSRFGGKLGILKYYRKKADLLWGRGLGNEQMYDRTVSIYQALWSHLSSEEKSTLYKWPEIWDSLE